MPKQDKHAIDKPEIVAEVTAAFEMLSAQLATQLVRTEAPHSVG